MASGPALALALLLAGSPKVPIRFADLDEPERAAAFARVALAGPVSERLLSASAGFLGAPYANDPLGEGPGNPPDEDPRLRWDAVDCTTFVETVLAIARAGAPEEVGQVLDDLRYDGPPSYENRNHFFDAQWIPANVRKGHLRDVTARVAGDRARSLTKTVTRTDWQRRRVAGRIVLPEGRLPLGSFKVTYLPLGQLLAVADRIPAGTVFTVVREDRPLTPLLVTHVGFVVPGPKGPMVRHANNRPHGRVVDEELARFVGRASRLGPWRVLGLQLLEALPAAPGGDPKRP